MSDPDQEIILVYTLKTGIVFGNGSSILNLVRQND